MEIVSIEKRTFEAMVAKLDQFVRPADAAGQRHTCLFANKPQDVLPP